MKYSGIVAALVLFPWCLDAVLAAPGEARGSGGPPAANEAEAGLVQQDLANTNSAWLIVVFKSTRRLYLLRDGQVVKGVRALKSELDPKFFGFLAGTPDDEVTIDFPADAAVSGLSGARTWKFDKKTPEGTYFVCEKDDRAHTNNTVALELGYPNLDDADWALKKGRITREQYRLISARLRNGECPVYDTYLGGYIKIHGPKDTDVVEWRKVGIDVCPDAGPGATCRRVDFREYLRMENPDIGAVVPGRNTFGCIVPELSVMFYLYREVPVGTPVVIHP